MKKLSLLLFLFSISTCGLANPISQSPVVWKNTNTEIITCQIPDTYNELSTQYCKYIKGDDYLNPTTVSVYRYAKLLGWNKVYKVGLYSSGNYSMLIIEVSK